MTRDRSTMTSTQLDPITLEVIRNALPAISDEMSADLRRASYNMMIYEVGDYCCALVAPNGDLIAQNGGGVSHFVSDLGVVVLDAIEQWGEDGFVPGDVLITNHQRVAGQHLNNVVVSMPVFVEEQLVCFSMVRAHWVDIGGLSTGFGAAGAVSDPWMEGLQLDQLKIHEAGVPNETLLRVIRANIRFPEASLGDLRSQIAACGLGRAPGPGAVCAIRRRRRRRGDGTDLSRVGATLPQRCRADSRRRVRGISVLGRRRAGPWRTNRHSRQGDGFGQ